MLKEKITYTDYDGNSRTEDFYFNLTQAEVTKMELSTSGGLVKQIEKIVAAQDGAAIIETFQNIILASYGEKSPDGKRFIKSKELSEGFSQTEAYSQLFMKLATDANAATAFINAITPSSIVPTSSNEAKKN
jgi:hypothetical protein